MTNPQIPTLTPEEYQILRESETNPNLFFAYFFEKPGLPAFQLDYGFEGDAKWQEDFCLAAQPMIVAICGVATGKTLTAGMSAFYHACVTPYFRFMNVGHELTQAKFMYDEILRFAQGTRAEKLIFKSPSSPHPKIEIKFYPVPGILLESELLFNSAGEKSDAMNIFSWRGDWINIEEAGRFTNLGEVVSKLTTRLTGSTAAGRPYMGRLSLISNPIDNPELWTIFDKAQHNPNALTFMIDTKDNKSVTDAQLQLQLDNIPEEEQEFYLTGKRPEGKGAYFSRQTVERCESEVLSQKLKDGLAVSAVNIEREDLGNGYAAVRKKNQVPKVGTPGFVGHYYPALGYWHYEFPYDPDRQYIMVGDPGTGAAPLRNAPVVMVVDVKDAPRINTIVALWWGNGGNRISPFITTYLELLRKYKPVFAGVDSTSNQKNMAEVMNMEYIANAGYSIEKIDGMDFSGMHRYQYLVACRISLEMGVWTWPKIATGLGAQLKSYDPIEDRIITSKLAQDLVSALSMASFASRALYPPEPDQQSKSDDRNSAKLGKNIGRVSEVRRTVQRSGARR